MATIRRPISATRRDAQGAINSTFSLRSLGTPRPSGPRRPWRSLNALKPLRALRTLRSWIQRKGSCIKGNAPKAQHADAIDNHIHEPVRAKWEVAPVKAADRVVAEDKADKRALRGHSLRLLENQRSEGGRVPELHRHLLRRGIRRQGCGHPDEGNRLGGGLRIRG